MSDKEQDSPDSVTGSGWINPERLLRKDLEEKGGYQTGKIEASEPQASARPPRGGGASSPPPPESGPRDAGGNRGPTK